MTDSPFPPPVPPESGDDLSRRLRSMVDQTAPPVTSEEARMATTTTTLRPMTSMTSPVWKVAAASLGALALAGSVTGYVVGRNNGRESASKRVITTPAATPAAVPNAARTPGAPAVANPVGAPNSRFEADAAGKGAAASSFGPEGPLTVEQMFGAKPELLQTRTVGSVRIAAMGTPMGDPYAGLPELEWRPPSACIATKSITLHAISEPFTTQGWMQRYGSVEAPIVNGMNFLGHPDSGIVVFTGVQVPDGVEKVRLYQGDEIVDETAPVDGIAILVNAKPSTDALLKSNYGTEATGVEAVYGDGRTAAAVYDGMPGSPSSKSECQPPPPPPPTLSADYTAASDADVEQVTAALRDVFAGVNSGNGPTLLENVDKFPSGWFADTAKIAEEQFGVADRSVNVASVGLRDGKAVAVFELVGAPLGWQGVELVKNEAGAWIVTTSSFCRIAGLANACPVELFDPNTDTGGPELVYEGPNYGVGGEDVRGLYEEVAATTVATAFPTIPVPAPTTTVPG